MATSRYGQKWSDEETILSIFGLTLGHKKLLELFYQLSRRWQEFSALLLPLSIPVA
jgi:hypothetical protein